MVAIIAMIRLNESTLIPEQWIGMIKFGQAILAITSVVYFLVEYACQNSQPCEGCFIYLGSNVL